MKRSSSAMLERPTLGGCDLPKTVHSNPKSSLDDRAAMSTVPPTLAGLTPRSGPTGGSSQTPLEHWIGGRYELLGEIARGGMGVVHFALDHSLRREVAIKTLTDREDADSPWSRRFLAEARIAGKLQHPGVPPVFDLGRTDDGRPFLAMKLITGTTLRGKLRQAKVDKDWTPLIRDFEQICWTMAYVHEQGVIHRDLKPDNIMIGDFGEVQVIDWGLAKYLDGREDEQLGSTTNSESPGNLTHRGDLLGTPTYMAPEQARCETKQVSTRSDVYSLGAMLYEILTGKPPYLGKTTTEIVKLVLEGPPKLPHLLNASVPKALEAICLKAMSRDAQQRYKNAKELAEDVQSWLNDEPIKACPETRVAKALRMVRRRPKAAAAIAASLLVCTLGSSVAFGIVSDVNQQLLESQKQTRDKAYLAEIKANEAIESEAKSEKAKQRTQRVLDFLVKAFRKPDPKEDGRNVTAYSILKQSEKTIQNDLKEDPLVQAEILSAIASTYQGLGVRNDVVPLRNQVYDLRKEHLGSDHRETIRARLEVLIAMGMLGQARGIVQDLKTTLPLANEKLGEKDGITFAAEMLLATALLDLGQIEEACQLFEAGRDKAVAIYGANHAKTLPVLQGLALSYKSLYQHQEALDLFEKLATIESAARGETAPAALNARFGHSQMLSEVGRTEEAICQLELIIHQAIPRLGAEHPDVLKFQYSLGDMLGRTPERIVQGKQLLEQMVPIISKTMGITHQQTLAASACLAAMNNRLGEPAKALPIWRGVAMIRKQFRGELHEETLQATQGVIASLVDLKQFDEAEKIAKESLALREKNHLDARLTAITRLQLGQALIGLNRSVEAIPLIEKAEQELLSLKDRMKQHEWEQWNRHIAKAMVDAYTKVGQIKRKEYWLARLGE
jgi:eukaryotic-like serine/threonine-protein kinase